MLYKIFVNKPQYWGGAASIRREDSAVRIRREDSAVRIRVGFWRVCVGFGAVDGAAQGGDQLAGFVEQPVGNA